MGRTGQRPAHPGFYYFFLYKFQLQFKFKFKLCDKCLFTLTVQLEHSMVIIYLFFYTNFGLYKSYPLNRNLVLEICKERVHNHIVSEHMHKQKFQHDV
jgi:hypothetical protein